ncbi:Tyrosine-protein phosphatase domain-containing protein [Entamoeba marina]
MAKTFQWLAENTAPVGEIFCTSKSSENFCKNRYKNILANENTLVPLGKYVNANYVCCGRYISCQAPIPTTIEDFFDMVTFCKSNIIVMLTSLKESGKKEGRYLLE